VRLMYYRKRINSNERAEAVLHFKDRRIKLTFEQALELEQWAKERFDVKVDEGKNMTPQPNNAFENIPCCCRCCAMKCELPQFPFRNRGCTCTMIARDVGAITFRSDGEICGEGCG